MVAGRFHLKRGLVFARIGKSLLVANLTPGPAAGSDRSAFLVPAQSRVLVIRRDAQSYASIPEHAEATGTTIHVNDGARW